MPDSSILGVAKDGAWLEGIQCCAFNWACLTLAAVSTAVSWGQKAPQAEPSA